MEQNETKTFIIKFAIWTILACLAPIGFIVYRFDLFQKVSKVNIGGWGLLVILIITIFSVVVGKYIKKGKTYSMTTQVITGLVKITLPLGLITLGLYSIRNNVELAIQVFGWMAISETIAIPFNPFPKWINDNKKKETDDLFDVAWNRHNEKSKK